MTGQIKSADLIKRIRGIGMKVRGLPALLTRPAKRYRKIAVYRDGDRRLGASLLEVADTDASRRQGLMGRSDLPAVCGMLFEGLSGDGFFWMKNCNIPLDVMFLDSSGNVTKVYSMPLDKGGKKHYPHDDQDVSAIEVPMGWCAKKGIAPGCSVTILPIAKEDRDAS